MSEANGVERRVSAAGERWVDTATTEAGLLPNNGDWCAPRPPTQAIEEKTAGTERTAKREQRSTDRKA